MRRLRVSRNITPFEPTSKLESKHLVFLKTLDETMELHVLFQKAFEKHET